MIDTYTNVFNFFPDNGVTEVLEGIVTVAKMIAVGRREGAGRPHLDGAGRRVPEAG